MLLLSIIPRCTVKLRSDVFFFLLFFLFLSKETDSEITNRESMIAGKVTVYCASQGEMTTPCRRNNQAKKIYFLSNANSG